MDSVHWLKIAFDVFLSFLLVLVMIYVEFFIKPFQSGYYCNDYSINMKFKSSTVSENTLLIIAATVPFLVILVSEFSNKIHLRFKNITYQSLTSYTYKVKLPNRKIIEVKEHFGNIYVNYGIYVIGLMLTTVVTLMIKKAVGRLRPNFLDVCKPSVNPYGKEVCNTFETGRTYVVPEVDFLCKTEDKRALQDSRLSFPSGHSSLTFYAAVFLICFLNRTWSRGASCCIVLHVIQILLFGFASLVALSRITDNKHHPTDVLAGSVLGSFVGSFTFYYLSQFYKKNNIKFRYNITQRNSETVTNESSLNDHTIDSDTKRLLKVI